MNGRKNAATPASSDINATSMSLLVRIKANDADAWNRLVTLYAPLVYYWCHKFHLAPADSADIFQDVFQSVAARIGGFRKEEARDSFRAWLRMITQNKIYDHFRRIGREPQGVGGTDAHLRLAQVPESPAVVEPCEENQVYQQLVQRALEMIRCEFTPRTWQAFWRVTVDGLSAVDVADELDMRPGAVRVAKSRVLSRLRQELGELLE